MAKPFGGLRAPAIFFAYWQVFVKLNLLQGFPPQGVNRSVPVVRAERQGSSRCFFGRG